MIAVRQRCWDYCYEVLLGLLSGSAVEIAVMRCFWDCCQEVLLRLLSGSAVGITVRNLV